MIKKLSYLFKKKWVFFISKKISVLVLDENFSNFKLNKNFYSIENELFVLELLKSIILKFFSKKNLNELYLYFVVLKFNPRIVIGCDLNLKVFLVKKIFPNLKVIAYQHGYIFSDDVNSFYKKIQNKSVDYYLVYDNKSKLILKKIFKAKFIISGSVKANQFSQFKIKKKYDYDIMYVSNFRPNITSNVYKNQQKDNYNFFSIISKYCEKKKLSLCIVLSSTRKDKIKYNFLNEELKFYKLITNNFFYNKSFNSFKLANRSRVVVSTNSNLGIELFYLKKKILFYNNNKSKYKFYFNKKFRFIFYKLNKKKVFTKLDNLINMSNNKWNRINSKFIVHNNRNKILKKIIYSKFK